MKFEKQIEEMAKIIRETTFIRGFEYSAAAGIFAAGYGKVKKERLKAYKEGYEQGKFNAAIETKKQTAREVLKILHGIGGCDATDDYSRGWDNAINEAYKEISDKYGVTAFDEEDEE